MGEDIIYVLPSQCPQGKADEMREFDLDSRFDIPNDFAIRFTVNDQDKRFQQRRLLQECDDLCVAYDLFIINVSLRSRAPRASLTLPT